MHRKLSVLFFALLSLLAVLPAAEAAFTRYAVLIDGDDSAATGCSIITPALRVSGIESVVTTTVFAADDNGSVIRVDGSQIRSTY